MSKKLLNKESIEKLSLNEQLEDITHDLSVMSDALAILTTAIVRAQRDVHEIIQQLNAE